MTNHFPTLKLILALPVCLLMLYASHDARAQSYFSVRLTIDNVSAGNDYPPPGYQKLPATGGGTGQYEALGTPLTAEVTVDPLNAGYEYATVACYANSTQIYFLTTSTSPVNWFQWTPPAAGTYTVYCEATWSGTPYGSAPWTATPNIYVPVVSTVPGYINPKYLIMAVTYAPPGGNSQSYVSYQDTNFVGNTTVDGSIDTNEFTESVTVTSTAGGSLFGFQDGAQVSGTQSFAFTNVSNSSNTVTLSKQTSTVLKTPGVPNVYSPVDHDYDIIWLWLNPVVLYTVPTTNTDSSGSIVWNGYGYDYNDPLHEIDVWPVYAGTLNGDFGTSFDCGGVQQPIDCQDAGVLARSWATTQNFAPGQGPGLTTADYATILGADPFAYNPYDQNSGYVLSLESGSSPQTTTDGRFSISEFEDTTPQSVPYKQAPLDSTQGEQDIYQDQYSTSDADMQGGSHTYQVGFGMDEAFGGTFFGNGVKYEFKENWTSSWENTYQNTVTNSNTQTDTVQITGPPCPATTAPCNPEYTEPHEFAVYQDNLYGSFMFWPNPYFSIGTVAPATSMIMAGGIATYTIPTLANAGYTGTLTSFSVQGLPSGATPVFSPSTGAAGTTFTLTVNTTAATPAGSYPLTISASDGSLSYFAYATLAVTASPGFTVSVTPSSETIAAAGNAAYTLTTTAVDGFDSTVDLNVDGLPSNSSASFSPETITGSGSSTLTINTTSNTMPGTYPLTFTGTSGSLNETASATLVVTGVNFVLSATPEFQSVNAGENTSYTVSVTAMNGFTGNVALTAPATLPTGVTATFSPTTITGGAGSSTLTLTTTSSTPAGEYPLSITGTSGTLTQTAPIDLEVNN